MRAVRYEQVRETPSVSSVPDPAPAEHGVVVRVGASGLCRSDWHGWMGHDPDVRLPHVPGHDWTTPTQTSSGCPTGWPSRTRLVVQGRLKPERPVTRTIGLEDAARELPLLGERPASGITVVDPSR